MSRSGNFNWRQDDSVVVRRQDAIAIYENEAGDVVIRQENEDRGEDDVVLVAPDRLDVVIADLIHFHRKLVPQAAPVRLTAGVVAELVAAGLTGERLTAACKRIEDGTSPADDKSVQ